MDRMPLPKFRFLLKWEECAISFSEVTGLDSEVEAVEYRGGGDPEFSPITMPGLQEFSNLTLKRGYGEGGPLIDWIKEIRSNVIKRYAMTIQLLDEDSRPAMTWQLTNAFPVKIEASDLNASEGEFAIETLELAHEGIRINTP